MEQARNMAIWRQSGGSGVGKQPPAIHRCVGDRLADLQPRILEGRSSPATEIAVMGQPQRSYSNFIRGI
jgi:hypothetical protein